MHPRRVIALDEMHLVAMPLDDAANGSVSGAAEHGGAADLVTVQVEDGEHGAVAYRVEETDSLPGAGQRPRFRLPVANHGYGQQIRIVEDGAIRMHEHVAKFTALVDRTRGRHADMARHTAGSRELAEQTPHPREVLRYLGVDL